MSKTIDEKVVEMRFDNRQFEANVSKSMSTLDKLKQALKFDKAGDSFSNLEKSAKKCDLSSIGNSADKLSQKFSALETVAFGALLRIGSQAVTTGEQLLKSLTVDNIMGGWSKYEEKVASVQTIMNATGKSVEQVNTYLDKLMWFSDETSYGFTDMASALGQLTSAGGDIDKLIPMITGIANATAFAGKNAAEFSRAIYNLNQSYSSGALKYMDWRSLEMAGVASKQLKELFIDTAIEMGKIEEGAVTLANFGETLKDNWADTEVMEAAFGKFAEATEAAYEMIQQGQAETATEAYQLLEDKYEGIAIQAAKAAQEAKTFGEVIDATKDAVSSGWMKTFELIFGNYEEAKGFFSQMAEDFYDIFAAGGSDRNDVLFQGLATGTELYTQAVADLAFELTGLEDEELAQIGYTRERAEQIIALNQALRDGTILVEDLMNAEQLGWVSGRSNLQQAIFNIRDALFLVDEETGEAVGLLAILKQAWSDIFPPITAERIYAVTQKLRELTESLIPSEETADRLKRTFSGLFAILDIGKELISAIVTVVKPLVQQIFGLSDGFLETTASVGDWLVALRDNIKENNIFLRALLTGIIVIKSWIEIIKEFAQSLNIPTFEQIKNSLIDFYNTVRDKFQNGGLDRIKEFIGRLREMDGFTLENIKAAFEDFWNNVVRYFIDFDEMFEKLFGTEGYQKIKDFIERLKSIDKLSLGNIISLFSDFKENIIDYFANSDGFFGKIATFFSSLKTQVRNTFAEIFGFADNAVDAAERDFGLVGNFFVGLKDRLFDIASEIRSKLPGKLGFSEIFTIGLSAANISFLKKIGDALTSLQSPLEGLTKRMKAEALEKKSEAMKNFATSILILVGALAALTALANKDWDNLVRALGILGVLAAGVAVFEAAMAGISKLGSKSDWAVSAGTILSIAASMLAFSAALKQLEGLEHAGTSFAVLAGLMAELLVVAKLIGSEKKQYTVGVLSLISFAVSLKMLVGTIRDIDNLEVQNAGKVILVMLGMIATLVAISKACRNVSFGASVTLIAAIASIKILIGMFDDLAGLTTDMNKVKKALAALVVILALFTAAMAASKLAGKHAASAGVAILAMAAAIKIIVGSFKTMEGLDEDALTRSRKVVTNMLALFAVITLLSAAVGKNANKAGTMLLMMSVAIMALSADMILLSVLDPEGLVRAGNAIAQMMVLFGALVLASSVAGKATGSIIAMTACLIALTAAVTMLSVLDSDQLWSATLALDTLIGMVALMIVLASNAEKAYGPLAVATAVVAALAGIFIGLNALDVQPTIETAGSLSILLLALTAALRQLDKVQNVSWKTMGALALLDLIVAGLAGIFAIMNRFNIQPSIEAASSLSVLLLGMSVVCRILGAVGSAGPAGFIGIGVLAVLIIAIGGIMAGISAIIKDNPTVEEDLDRVIGILNRIGSGLGQFVGGIINGFIKAAYLDTLEDIGTSLTNFATNAQGFIDIVGTVGENVANGAKSLSVAIMAFGEASVFDSWTRLCTLDPKHTRFTNSFTSFVEAIKDAIDIVAQAGENISTTAIEDFSTAGIMLIDMVAAIDQNGGLNNIDKLGELGTQLVAFVGNLKGISDALSGESGSINVDILNDIAEVGTAFVDMSANLQRFGGGWSFVAGHNDLASYGEQVAEFVGSLKGVSDKLAELGGIDTDTLSEVAEAGKLLIEMTQSLPRSGGVANSIVGFSQQMKEFGEGLGGLCDATKGKIDLDELELVKQASTYLIEISKSLSRSGDAWQDIIGEKNLSALGGQLAAYGTGIVELCRITKGNIDLTAIELASQAGTELAEMAKTIPLFGGEIETSVGTDDLDEFTRQLKAFANGLAYFSETIGGKGGVAVLQRAAEAGNELTDMAVGALDTFGDGDLTEVATQYKAFGNGIAAFSDSVQGHIDNRAINMAKEAVDVLSNIEVDNTGGFWAMLTGEPGLGVFGEQIEILGTGLADFSDIVNGHIDMQAINMAADAAELLAGVDVSNTKGLWNHISGNNDLGAFGSQLGPFGSGLASFADSVNGHIDLSAISTAADAANVLATIDVTNTNGFWGYIAGSNDLAQFGLQLESLGTGLASFSDSVSGHLDMAAIENAADATEKLSNVNVRNDGSLWSQFAGRNDLEKFGAQLNTFGKGLASFSDSVTGHINLEAVRQATEAASLLASINVPNTNGTLNEWFGENNLSIISEGLQGLGENLASFTDATSGDVISSFSDVVELLGSFINTIRDVDGADFENLGDIFQDMIENGLDQLTPERMSEMVTPVVHTMMKSLSDAIRDQAESAKQAVRHVMSGAASTIREYREDFRTAGRYAAQGFVEGVREARSEVTQAAAEIGDRAIKATRNSLHEKSPSKDGWEIGKYYTQGVANGISETKGEASRAASEVANAVVNATSETVDKIYGGSGTLNNSLSDISAAVRSSGLAIESATASTINSINAVSGAVNQATQETKGAGATISSTLRQVDAGITGYTSSVNDAASASFNLFGGIDDAVSSTVSAFKEDGIIAGISEGWNHTGLLSNFGSSLTNFSTDLFSVDSIMTTITGDVDELMESLSGNTTSVLSDQTFAVSGLSSAYGDLASSISVAEDATLSYYDATIKRTSDAYDYLITHLGDGLTLGIHGGVEAEQFGITEDMVKQIKLVTSMGLDVWKDWVEEKQYYNELSLVEEEAGWQMLQAMYLEGTEERKEADRELYRVQNELVESAVQYSTDWIDRQKKYYGRTTAEIIEDMERVQARLLPGSEAWISLEEQLFDLRNDYIEESYQAQLDWIEEEKYYNRLSVEEELALYQKMQTEYVEGSEQRMAIDRQVYTLRKQLMDDYYQAALDWIEEEEYYDRLTPIQKLSAYKQLSKTLEKGSDEQKKADREIYTIEKEIYEAKKDYEADVLKVQEDAAQKRLDLEEEYADKVASINEKLASDIDNLNQKYEDALESRADTLYKSYGLFDEVSEREEISGQQLLNNLQGQVEEFNEWQNILSRLSGRGVDSALIEELEEMGPSAISQIQALESLSDTELNRYVNLWKVKHTQARSQAIDELEDMRYETQDQIQQLRADAAQELAEYEATWQEKMAQIDIDANAELDTLRQTFQEKVGLIAGDTEEETTEMVEAVAEILREGGWDDLADEIINDLSDGVESRSSEFRWAMYNTVLEGLAAAQDALAEYGIDTSNLGDILGGLGFNVTGNVSTPSVSPVATLDTWSIGEVNQLIDDVVANLDASVDQTQLASDLARQFSEAQQRQSFLQEQVNLGNETMVEALHQVQEEIAHLSSQAQHFSVVLDTGTVVGAMTPMYDDALGQQQLYAGRGI